MGPGTLFIFVVLYHKLVNVIFARDGCTEAFGASFQENPPAPA